MIPKDYVYVLTAVYIFLSNFIPIRFETMEHWAF